MFKSINMQNNNSRQTCYQHKYNINMHTNYISKLTINTNSSPSMRTNNKNLYMFKLKQKRVFTC
jgi:hypothetical protein